MARDTAFNAQSLIAQQLLKQSQTTSSPIAAAIGGFLGARGLHEAERMNSSKLQERELEQQQLKSQLAQSLLGQNATPEQIDQFSQLSEGQLQKALAGKLFPEKKDPIKLGAGETLISPTGEQIFRAPEKAKDIAQTRKFELEARQLERDLDRGGVKPEKVFEQTQKLRKEFTTLSGEFVKQRDAFTRIRESAVDPSAAGDLALIFNYMKLLDPGSVVREGEFANAQNTGDIDAKVFNLYNKVLTGERLAPEQRDDFTGRAGKLFKAANRQQDKRIGTFSDLAVKSDLDPEQVAIDMGLVPIEAAPPQEAQSQQAQEGTVVVDAQGKRLVLQNGQWRPL